MKLSSYWDYFDEKIKFTDTTECSHPLEFL